MTTKTKVQLRRNFMPKGALRRGILFLCLMWVVAYAPPAIAHAFS